MKQKPKELDYLKEYNEWVETTGLVAKGTSYYYEIESIIENALTQQRTELLEEISKLKIGERNENDGDDRSWNKFTYYYNQALDKVKNLLNKKNETK